MENEIDSSASDEIKGETYNTSERWVMFIVIYVVSLIICIIYLFFRTDVKQFSIGIFALCLLYFSLFVMLNVISMFDLIFSSEKGMVKFFKMVSTFYEVFNWVDKILGYVIFNLLIAMMESGYKNKWYKFWDYLIKIWKSIPKKKGEIIRNLIIAIVISVVLIIFKKRFDLGNNPFDYFSIILDVFGMCEIYSNVGFFMLQIILDYRRKRDQTKINRYDIYSKLKIIEKTEKYMKKVKDCYDELKKDAKIFKKNDQPDFHKYLQKLYKEMKEKVIEYGYEVNDEDTNLDYIKKNCPNDNANDNKVVQCHINQLDFQNYIDEKTSDRFKKIKENKENIEVKKEDFNTSKNIRKFKKAVRRINKLKKLYHEIDKDTKEDLDRLRMNKKCTWVFVILFIAFSIALLSDFFLPLSFDPEDDFTKSAGEPHERFDSIGALIFGIIVAYPFSVITSSYTVIMIYATNRKNYISGDYLYDKQINDNISLLKTVQIICGYSFSILYCNIYLWRTLDSHGHYGKPKFYETTFIPDYTLKQGITIFMIAKMIIIVGSMIGSYFFSSWDLFKNDLGEFNRSDGNSSNEDQIKLNRIYQEKGQVVSILYRK